MDSSDEDDFIVEQGDKEHSGDNEEQDKFNSNKVVEEDSDKDKDSH